MINITTSPQITKIYLVENCYGDPNKVYIGKTKNRTRQNDHKIKYGKDIIFTYIDEIESLESKDWKPLECFWIEYFRQLGFEILNKNEGGGGLGMISEKTRNKMSQSHLGKGGKMILQYDLKGNFIREWSSIIEASQNLGIANTTISNCCVGIIRSCYKYVFSFTPLPKNYKYIKNQTSSKKIQQFDIQGNFIKQWNSLSDVERELGFRTNNISMCLKGNTKSANKFIWKYN